MGLFGPTLYVSKVQVRVRVRVDRGCAHVTARTICERVMCSYMRMIACACRCRSSAIPVALRRSLAESPMSLMRLIPRPV